jgi:radical SAM protein with 4Fe4S-binding SPASM domain
MGTGGCAIAADPGNLYVDHRGNIVPCCFHPGAALLGNLGQDRLSMLRAGDRRAAFLRALETRRAAMPVCNRCEMGADWGLGPPTEAVTRFSQGGAA